MDSIAIKGYKSIRDLHLQLKPINILIGANGSGKSNFLSFFDLLQQLYRQNLRQYLSLKREDTLLHHGPKVTEEIAAHLYFEGRINEYSFTLKRGEAGFLFTEEALWFNDKKHDIASFGAESDLRFDSSERADYIRAYLGQIRKYHFHDTGERSPFNNSSNIENDTFELYERGGQFGCFLVRYSTGASHRLSFYC